MLKYSFIYGPYLLRDKEGHKYMKKWIVVLCFLISYSLSKIVVNYLCQDSHNYLAFYLVYCLIVEISYLFLYFINKIFKVYIFE